MKWSPMVRKTPHDILRLKGVSELARYIVKEIQDVYRLEGVTINDKHIEVIVCQMLRKVEIKEPGDTSFIKGEQVEYIQFLEQNERMVEEGKQEADGERVLLGINQVFSGYRIIYLGSFVPGNYPGID